MRQNGSVRHDLKRKKKEKEHWWKEDRYSPYVPDLGTMRDPEPSSTAIMQKDMFGEYVSLSAVEKFLRKELKSAYDSGYREGLSFDGEEAYAYLRDNNSEKYVKDFLDCSCGP